MEKASELVRACVLAGYSKIHLDASMRCADDPGDPGSPLSQELITERAADLCRAAEAAYAELRSGAPAPVYVLGTEVPAPGGDSTAGTGPEVTTVGDLERTIVLSQRAFRGRGLESAWERTAALVVQPGVEFGDASISEYDREKVRPLSKYIETNWHVAFEAHSTDYQKGEALRQMVRDHFAFLKVGPWLTFAFREAVFALELMEQEWLSGRKGVKLSSIREILDGAMRENPEHWLKYYRGDEAAIGFARKYSFSDRSRYYWSQPVVQEALDSLGRNLTGNPVPLMLLSQYLPVQCEAVRQGRLRNTPVDIIRHKIAQVLDIYAGACGMRP